MHVKKHIYIKIKMRVISVNMELVITQSNLTLFGGAERVLLKIAAHYDAKIYTLEYNPNTTFEEFKNLNVIKLKSNPISNMLPYGRIKQGINYGLGFYNMKIKDDYDVINAHMAPSHWIRNKNERVLWYCHTPLRDIYDLYKYRLSMKRPHQKPIYIIGARAVRMIDKSVTKKIDFIFTNSLNTQSRVKEYYKRDDSEVLYAGIDAKKYKNNGDDKFFFYPSRISPNKRQEFAIAAFKLFSKKIKNYKLIIAGGLSKDGAFQNYYDLIKELSKDNKNIKIATNISELEYNDLLSRCTAVLFPPINEDYGLVPLEAMASGKPVIAINEGGPKETIINKKSGFLVNTIEEMAERMAYISENPSIAIEMGKIGKKHVTEKFSWELFFEKFDRRARQISKGKSRI